MPTAQVLIRQQNGQTIVLAEGDRIIKEVTIPCSSQRCPSRHGQSEPVTFTFNDHDLFPEEGDQFLSLILPERSPSNQGGPLPFCGPSCLKDFLTYQYFSPGPRQPASTEIVQETPVIPNALTMADVEASVGSHDLPEPTVIGQADGSGE